MAARSLSEIQDIVSELFLLDLEDALNLSVDLIPISSLSETFLTAIRGDEVLLYESS